MVNSSCSTSKYIKGPFYLNGIRADQSVVFCVLCVSPFFLSPLYCITLLEIWLLNIFLVSSDLLSYDMNRGYR
jgi:hypothetical protein